MTQTPVTVTYTLEEVLGQLSQKLDRMDSRLEDLHTEVVDLKIGQAQLKSEIKGDMKSLESELRGEMNNLSSELRGEMKTLESTLIGKMSSLDTNLKTLETEVKGIGKRLDTQEFINRSVVVGFILALVVGAIKLFLPTISG